MKTLTLFFETKNGKYIKNLIIGFGASIVLLGALFKLQHWEGAGLMLTIGMVTEAFIFALQGIVPPVKDYYWERYYPNLDENPEIEAYRKGVEFVPPSAPLGAAGTGGGSATGSLDKMLEEANINTPNLKRLSENFQKFGQTVEQIKDITDVTAATGEYSQSAREAASSLSKLKETYSGAINTMQSFNEASESTAQFHQQVQVLSRNLGNLNQIYEVELQDANNHLKAMNKFYSNLVSASDAMAASAGDAMAAKEQIAMLSKNLSSLNNIYGNMLTAMQGR
jgi:gliding motility-associated protein GldL